MRRYKITALVLCAAMALSAAAGCSDSKTSRSISTTSQQEAQTEINTNNEGRAENEVSASVAEKANANSTDFTLNKVIDAGTETDKGERYIFLDVTIDNSTDKQYELNTLNNFYLLLNDGSEAHYDVRTQLYAAKNIDGYEPNPFTVPANGQFSGIVGGFAVDKDVKDFKVCFFPTLDNERNKSDVVKVDVSESDITVLTTAK